ncbi:MAG TPA: hypothetical protein VFA00_09625 [Actinomycetota bacterium]|nr:hypothetical protein [Actinomycetota bacterium]
MFTPSVRKTSSKGPENLRVPVPDALKPLPYCQVAGLLGDPRGIGVRGDSQDVNTAGPDLDHDQHVQGPEQEHLDGEEVQRQDPSSLGPQDSLQVEPPRRGAGPSPARRSNVRIFVADTLMPSWASSPRILMHPQLGLSLPIPTMRARTSSGIGGL